MEETIGKIMESDESNQKKIKQLDDFFWVYCRK
jgi:hypothetical protein